MKTRHKKGGIESGGGVSAALMMFPALFLLVAHPIRLARSQLSILPIFPMMSLSQLLRKREAS